MAYKLLNFTETKFKKFGGEFIDDIVNYVNEYVKTGEDIRVMVGCDSHQRRRHTTYALVIVLYDIALRNGAHVLFMRIRDRKERDMFTRLMNESLYSLDISEYLEKNLGSHYNPKFEKNDYDGSYPIKRIEIHADVNPEEGINKRNKSNIVYSSVMGMLSGNGFPCKCKPDSYCASCAADLLCK
jgi:uncharacterized protein